MIYPKVARVNARYVSIVDDRPKKVASRYRIQNMEKVRKIGRSNNDISQATARKIKKAINWMVTTSDYKTIYSKKEKKHLRFKLNFITLTLPAKQVHDDLLIKQKCLQPFLQWLRDRYKVRKYIWRAELQQNGNIHFHILTDKFVHYIDIRNTWNKQVERLGYIDSFESKFGHRTPNSTDVHSIKKIDNLGAYLSKYMAKQGKDDSSSKGEDGDSRVLKGRWYGISDVIGKIEASPIKEGSEMWNLISRACLKERPVVFNDWYYSVVFISLEQIVRVSTGRDKQIVYDYLMGGNFTKDEVKAIFSNAHRPTHDPRRREKRSASPPSQPSQSARPYRFAHGSPASSGSPPLRAQQSQLISMLHPS